MVDYVAMGQVSRFLHEVSTISFVVSDHLVVHPRGLTQLPLERFFLKYSKGAFLLKSV